MTLSVTAARTLHLHPDVVKAYSVLEGAALSRELAFKLALLPGPAVLDLISLAHKVKLKFAPSLHVCSIMNIKSGACSEDCKFCAQSAHHQTLIEVYPLVSPETMLDEARSVHAQGVRTFGLVSSGLGYFERNAEFEAILASIRRIRQALPDMKVCASLGLLSEATAQALAEVGLVEYNCNLQVRPDHYHLRVSTTHTIEARMETIRLLQRVGIVTCTGGILGLGESMTDRIEMAYALKDLQVDVIPLNVLIPISGTAAGSFPNVPVLEIAKTFALFRLILPDKTIKFAAGRETRLKDFQGLLMLAGANGFLTGGYLTTRGRAVAEDQAFQQELERFNA